MAALIADLPLVLVLIGTTLMHYAERRVHGYNYDFLQFANGEELIPRTMRRYYAFVVLIPWVSLASAGLVPKGLQLEGAAYLGLCLVLLGAGIRLWSIRSLGRLWTQRCMFVSGMPRVRRGPYRIFRHPEYFGRAVEGLGFVLFFNANPISLYFWAYTQRTLLPIVKTESRQLNELAVGSLHLQPGSSRVNSLNS